MWVYLHIQSSVLAKKNVPEWCKISKTWEILVSHSLLTISFFLNNHSINNSWYLDKNCWSSQIIIIYGQGMRFNSLNHVRTSILTICFDFICFLFLFNDSGWFPRCFSLLLFNHIRFVWIIWHWGFRGWCSYSRVGRCLNIFILIIWNKTWRLWV